MGRLVLARKATQGMTIFDTEGNYFGEIMLKEVRGSTVSITTLLSSDFRIVRNELLTAEQVVQANQARAFIVAKKKG